MNCHNPVLKNIRKPKAQMLLWALFLLIITTIPTVIYYLNYPRVEINPDTITYLRAVGHFFDPTRLPGYRLFIGLIYLFAGYGNLIAVSNVQALLFILMTLEIYVIALLIFRRIWLAFLIGLLVGTNIIIIAYIKPIMSEGLAALLFTTFILSMVLFIKKPHVKQLCAVTLSLLLLIFTRPEWVYLPIILFPFLLLIVMRKGDRKQLIQYSKHIGLSFLFIYLCLFIYIGINGGLTSVTNMNLLGKVLQYHMEDESQPQDQLISRYLDICIARIDRDPYHVASCVPEFRLSSQETGQFAKSIIIHHPREFLLKSIPLFFSSLTDYYDVNYHLTMPPGPFDAPLSGLKAFHQALYQRNVYFPICAVIWLFLLFWKRTASQPEFLAMGAIIICLIYGIIITAFAGYFGHDYMRFHIVFDPLLILVLWGSVFRIIGKLLHI